MGVTNFCVYMKNAIKSLNFSYLLNLVVNTKYFNRWVIFVIDLFFSVFSTVTSFALVSYVIASENVDIIVLKILLSSICCSIICFLSCQTYKGIIRHSAFTETGRIAMASLLKVACLAPVLSIFVSELSFRETLFGCIADLFLTFFVLTIVRALLIISYSLIVKSMSQNQGKLLVYVKDTSMTILNEKSMLDKLMYRMVGFLTIGSNRSLRSGKYKIYSVDSQKAFNHLVNQQEIKAILFPDYQTVKEESERLVRYCEKKKVRMLVLPSIDELKEGKTYLRNLPEVRIEDLLGRDEIDINMTEIAESLADKAVMVTGAAGSIGSELCRQLCLFNIKHLVLFDSAETPLHNIRLELEEKYPDVRITPVMGDVRMIARIESVFRRFHPQIVFHAAAYKHVPLMEENPCEAVCTNVLGTQNMANISVEHNVEKFIMISTDKAVNPTNVMGASKRLAEIYVQSLSTAISKGLHSGKTRFITTRFGNVLGSNGSVIPRFREQLAKGGPLTVTHPDIIRYFMTIPEACRLVLEAAFMGRGNEVFVFDMGQPVKIADLAYRMIELAGLTPGEDIEISYTGLRPGEKLYEELLSNKENTIPTPNKKILRAKVREYDYNDIATVIMNLKKVAIMVDKLETVRMMKMIVPEFKSKNSEYEVLDKDSKSN